MQEKEHLYFVDASIVVKKLKGFLDDLMEKDIPVLAGCETTQVQNKRIGQMVFLKKVNHYFTVNQISGAINCCKGYNNNLFSFKEDSASFLASEYRPLLKLMGLPDDFGVLPFYTDSKGSLWINDPAILEIWQNLKPKGSKS